MTDPEDLMPEIEETGARLVQARAMIARRIIGQEAVVEQTLIAILCGGHGLLVGAPGLAKTRLVETLGTVLGLVAHRVQFTPDLMPADILGAEVLETGPDGSRAFRFIDGPIFCQLMMADEINRASPAHPVGAAAGDAGEGGLGRRPAAHPAGALPRARDAEPDRAGGHLSPARGAARPVPVADRRRLSRAGGGARDHPRHHRRRGGLRRAGVRRGEPDRGAAADPPAAGRRGGGGEDPRPGALGAAGHAGRASPRSTTR